MMYKMEITQMRGRSYLGVRTSLHSLFCGLLAALPLRCVVALRGDQQRLTTCVATSLPLLNACPT